MELWNEASMGRLAERIRWRPWTFRTTCVKLLSLVAVQARREGTSCGK
jgi:hypothetical protein